MASKVTNWGKAFLASVALTGVDPDGNAAPANFYLILIDSSYNWASVDPDHHDITDITGRIDPSNYSGNAIARSGAAWTRVVDDANDKGTIAPATSPVLTAAGNMTNIKGFALAVANSIVTAKVISLNEFGSAFNLNIGNTLTITGSGLEGS